MGNAKNNVVGFTCSTFDLLHAGHVAMLREAKEQCDYLIVGLQVDPSIDRKNKTKLYNPCKDIFTTGVKYVDEIIPHESERKKIPTMYKFYVRIEVMNTVKPYRQRVCESLGIDPYFNSRNHRFSSSDLRARTQMQE